MRTNPYAVLGANFGIAGHLSFLRSRAERCVKRHKESMQPHNVLTRAEYQRELDRTLAGSFPASDPPPWTLGASPWRDVEDTVVAAPVPAAIDVIFQDGRRLGGIRLASLGEAIALAAMVPIALLIAGVPVVALVWGIANAISWLTSNI